MLLSYLKLFPVVFPDIAFMYGVLKPDSALLYAFGASCNKRMPLRQGVFVIKAAVCAGFGEPVAFSDIVFGQAGTFRLFFEAVFVVGAAAGLKSRRSQAILVKWIFVFLPRPVMNLRKQQSPHPSHRDSHCSSVICARGVVL